MRMFLLEVLTALLSQSQKSFFEVVSDDGNDGDATYAEFVKYWKVAPSLETVIIIPSLIASSVVLLCSCIVLGCESTIPKRR